jgi:uracil-DNA glycosylase
VNCKKTVGSEKCPNAVLRKHLETYGDLLQEQIALYDADIILCCGGSDLIKDFIKEKYLPDLEAVEGTDWMYFSRSTNKLVVNSYHPSYMGCSPEKIYESMMWGMKKFLEQFPTFTKSDR